MTADVTRDRDAAHRPTTTREHRDRLRVRREVAVGPGSERAAARQRASGKLLPRERIALLVDPGSFTETDQLARHRTGDQRPGDAVVTGTATVHGRPICLFAQDATVAGGSVGEIVGTKIVKIMDLAARMGCPIVGLNDSGGARIHEGVAALAFYAEIGRRNARLSGVVPQISMILGPCAGGAVYSPAMTDFVVMVEGISHMFVTGPEVMASVTGEVATFDELGGPTMQAEVAGNAHHVAADEPQAFAWVRELLGMLPSSCLELPPQRPAPSLDPTPADLSLDTFMVAAQSSSYDVRDVLEVLADDAELLEVSARFGRSVVTALARLDGRPVGLVANQASHNAGVLDIDASEKAARFVRFCDAFSLPVVTVVDVPGYLPGVDQERRGIIRRGATLLYAYAEATVPLVTVVIGKAYGGGYATMGSKHLGADVNLAWPNAQIAVMGGAGAVQVLHRRTLEEAAAGRYDEVRDALIRQYDADMASPYLAAERGYLDAVIEPWETRRRLVYALRMLQTKRATTPPRKHGNIPI